MTAGNDSLDDAVNNVPITTQDGIYFLHDGEEDDLEEEEE